MENTIITIYNGSILMVSAFVANQLGIRNGYHIQNEEEFWKILEANAEYNLTAIKAITKTTENWDTVHRVTGRKKNMKNNAEK